MGRIAGDAPGYTYRLCRMVAGIVAKPTKHGHTFPSATEIIGATLAKPPSAMGWWGYRIGLTAVHEAITQDGPGFLSAAAKGPEELEEYLKGRGVSPNMSLDSAGDRGSKAHLVLECLAEGWRQESEQDADRRIWAEALAMDEEFESGTRYGWAAIEWWDNEIQLYIDSGAIVNVLSEVPVESLEDAFAGTFDIAFEWDDELETGRVGWEIVDGKTHKPANGFTKPGKGPGYISDAVQMRSYRKAAEEMSSRPLIWQSPPLPPGAKTIGQRAVILRDRAYKAKSYLEDFRDVPYRLFELLREVYDIRKEFERGDEED